MQAIGRQPQPALANDGLQANAAGQVVLKPMRRSTCFESLPRSRAPRSGRQGEEHRAAGSQTERKSPQTLASPLARGVLRQGDGIGVLERQRARDEVQCRPNALNSVACQCHEEPRARRAQGPCREQRGEQRQLEARMRWNPEATACDTSSQGLDKLRPTRPEWVDGNVLVDASAEAYEGKRRGHSYETGRIDCQDSALQCALRESMFEMLRGQLRIRGESDGSSSAPRRRFGRTRAPTPRP